MTSGGFPEAVARERQAARTRWLRSCGDRVVERDLAALIDLRRSSLLAPIVAGIAAETANVSNMTALAARIGAAPDTVRHYVDLLERVFLVRRLPAWAARPSARLSRHPKLHIADNGLAAALAGLDATALRTSSYVGQLLESFVVGELDAQRSWSDQDVAIEHYRATVAGTRSTSCSEPALGPRSASR